MIVRDDGKGLIIIRQGDHAALTAEIAKAWHPPGKPRARPANSLLAAAAHHDAGWRAWEDGTPDPLDETTGRPRDFLHMPLEDHLTIWRDSIDQTTRYDLYAGVLVSMHACALYELRLETVPDPEADRSKIRDFVGQQAGWQAQARTLLAGRPYYAPHLSEKGLAANLKLLQVWDFLSLMLCVPWTGTHTFEEVRLPGGGTRTLTASAAGDGILTLEPYPLHAKPFPLTVQGRRLTRQQFEKPADLAQAYAAAPTVTLKFAVRAA